MLRLKVLTRMAALGLRSSATLARSGAAGGLEEPAAAARGGWRRLLEGYGGAAHLLAKAGAPPARDGKERRDSRPLHTGAGLLMAARQEGSTFNDPDAAAREAGRPTSGASGGDLAPGEGAGRYILLAAAHAGLAATCFLAPTALANLFFPGAALPQGFETQALVKLLGCGAGVGAAASYGLGQLAGAGQLASSTAQRLQLGLLGFSSGAIALHGLYAASLTGTSLLAGGTVMGLTFLVPYQHYVKTNGGLKPGQALASYFGAVPDHLRVTGLQSSLYSLLTPVLALAGASYLFAPGLTLTNVFGFVKGVDAFFWWQCVGGGLATVAPAVTFSLKKLADEGRLGEPVAKTLNLGVVAAALGHLAVMGPMVAANQGGPMLPWVVGAWGAALLTGGMGLFGGGGAKAAA